MSPYDPKVYLNLATALAAEMLETFGYGSVAEVLWRVDVRLAGAGELDAEYAACVLYTNGYKDIAVAPKTLRDKTELALALFLIHEAVHVLDPQWHHTRQSVSRTQAAKEKAELDADDIALDIGQKWLERLRHQGQFDQAMELVEALAFLREHWMHHRQLFVRNVLHVAAFQ
jgi:pterin-4a-carbinolamine dehydratase